MTHRTPVGGWYGNKRVSTETSNRVWFNAALVLVFPWGRINGTESVCTWYDFRCLDLHKALFGEGFSEELAHSGLQAKYGLAGGRLWEDKHAATHRETFPHLAWSIGFITHYHHNRCVKTRLPISVHATPLNMKGETSNLLARARHAFKASESPRYFKPVIINVNAETKAGREIAQTKQRDYGKNLSPKTATGNTPFIWLTHLKWPHDFYNWALLALNFSYYTP